jgi:hypothetical protein
MQLQATLAEVVERQLLKSAYEFAVVLPPRV